MHVLALLRRWTVHQHIVKMLETIVTMSEILYATDDKRSPWQILRLYNSTWLHHELCNDLLPNVKSIPRMKLFASYHDHDYHHTNWEDTVEEDTLTNANSTTAEIPNAQSDLSGLIGVDETCSIQTATELCEDVIVTNKENKTNTTVTSYKTKLCTAVQKILGSEYTTGAIKRQLDKLDTLRHCIRTNKGVPQRTIANYECLLAAINEHITARRTVLKKAVKEFENGYYMSHHTLPDLHSNSDYRHLVKSYRSVCRLLESGTTLFSY